MGNDQSAAARVNEYRVDGDDRESGYAVLAVFDTHQGRRQGVVAVREGALENYNPETGDRRLRVLPQSGQIACAAFAPRSQAGRVLAYGTDSGRVVVAAAQGFKLFKSEALPGADEGERLPGQLGVELTGEDEQARARSRCAATAIAVTGADEVIVGASDGVAYRYSISTGPVARTYSRLCPQGGPCEAAVAAAADAIAQAHTPPVVVAVASFDGKVAVGCSDGVVALFRHEDGVLVGQADLPGGFTDLVAMPELGALLATYSHDVTAQAWDLRSNSGPTAVRLAVEDVPESPPSCVHYHRGRKLLVTGGADGSFFVWECSRGAGLQLRPIKYGRPRAAHELTSVWFDAATDRLVTGDSRGTVRLVERVSGSSSSGGTAGGSSSASGDGSSGDGSSGKAAGASAAGASAAGASATGAAVASGGAVAPPAAPTGGGGGSGRPAGGGGGPAGLAAAAAAAGTRRGDRDGAAADPRRQSASIPTGAVQTAAFAAAQSALVQPNRLAETEEPEPMVEVPGEDDTYVDDGV